MDFFLRHCLINVCYVISLFKLKDGPYWIIGNQMSKGYPITVIPRNFGKILQNLKCRHFFRKWAEI